MLNRPTFGGHINIDAGFVSMAMIDDGYRDSYQFEKKKWALIKNGFTHFKDGDIAVAKISPCLENRKSMILKNLPNGIGAGTTELHIFRSAIVDSKFALYFFKSDHFINQCVGTFNGVVGQQRVGSSCYKVSVYDVRGNLAYLSFIRLISSLLSLAIQAHLHHKSLYCLMVKVYAIITQLRGYSSITITTFMMIKYLTDCSSGIIISIRL